MIKRLPKYSRILLWAMIGVTALKAGSIAESTTKPRIESFTLQELKNQLETTNLDLLLQNLQLEQAHENTRIERSGLLPSAQLYAQTERARDVDLNGGKRTEIEGPFTESGAGIRSEVPLFDLKQWYRWQASKAALEGAQIEQTVVKERLFQAACVTYFQAIFAAELTRQSLDAIERNKDILLLSQQIQSKGFGDSIDVVRSNFQLHLNQERLREHQSLLQEQLSDLRIFCNLESTPQTLTIYSANPTPTADISTAVDPDKLAGQARLKLANQRLVETELLRKSAFGGHVPSIALTGEYNRLAQRLDFSNQEAWRIGVEMQIPVFDGLRTRAETRKASLQEQQQRILLEKTHREIAENILVLANRIQAYRERVNIINKQVLLAKLELEFEKLRFEDGIASSQDIVLVLNKLSSAEIKLAQMEFEYHRSLVDFAYETGNVFDLASLFEPHSPLNLKNILSKPSHSTH